MQTLDLIIIFGYLIGITAFGIWYAGKQETTEEYFVGDRSVPWWAIAMSIVATETSTITFISVPGIAFAKGGNFQFLQLVFGYLLGRVVISLVFIPMYFKGDLQTVYQLLGERFGGRVKIVASGLFVIMRNIADGIRLLLTAFVLAAVYTAFQPTADPTFVIVGSIVLLGVVMIIFTFFGGMEAVIWIEVVQLVIYIGGAVAAAVVLISNIDGGIAGAIDIGSQFNKFSLFDFNLDFTKTYTFWGGLLGGCFLTMSTHGTDQFLVQRYLCTNKPSAAITALMTSGAVVLGQFIGFLFIGVLLFAFYSPYNLPAYETATGAFPFTGGDKVFPDFITQKMPTGLSGLVVAAIFAAALSSSLNSIAATAVNDIYKPFAKNVSDKHLMRVAGILTVIVGIVQIAIAVSLKDANSSALGMALSVASLINGPILGVFLVGAFVKRAREPHALAGMTASIAVMLYVLFATSIAWPWYALIGSSITVAVAFLTSALYPRTIMKTLTCIAVFAALVCSMPAGRAATKFEPSKKSWEKAEKLLRKMTVDEKIGQLIHVGVNARFANQDSAFFKELRRHVTENKVGGIIFFVGPVYDTVHLANRMQEAAKIPLMMSLDAETGVGMRLENAITFPWAMAVAATGEPDLARRMGAMTGREARATGFRYIYSPVLDVNNNADNPVINVRSFGEDPEEVAKYGVAFIDGVQSEGVIATAKHFPGHGDTNVDSHRALPIIDRSRKQLDSLELIPFRRAIDSGVASIMIAHIGLPQLDAEEMKPLESYTPPVYSEDAVEKVTQPGFVPASLSTKIQTGILRNELGFKGLIVSDALDMSGLTIYLTPEDAGVRALNAGTDILLKPGNADAMIRGLKSAVASGRVTEARLNDAVLKQLAWKYEFGLFKERFISLDSLDRTISGNESAVLADEIGEKAITLVRNDENLLPVDRNKKIALFGISNGFDIASPMAPLTAILRQNGLKFSTGFVQENSTAEQITAARKAVNEADLVIVGLYGRVRSGAKNSVGLPEAGSEILREALAANKKVIGISFGNPYILRSFPGLKTYVVAYGDMPSLQRGAARSILGLQGMSGRLPISLPGLYPRGTGIQIKK
jgi:SSS family transporter